MWVLAADELTVWQTPQSVIQQLEPNFKDTIILAEAYPEKPTCWDSTGNHQPGPFRDANRANFALTWSAGWYPQFLAKMHPYPHYGNSWQDESAFSPNLKAVVFLRRRNSSV